MYKPDFNAWDAELPNPLWYQLIVPELKRLTALHDTDRNEYERVKESIYDFFEDRLSRNAVALGSTGENWDSERQPIDTVVIHHTSNPPGLRLSRLSAIELVRLYAPQYMQPQYGKNHHIVGQPIWSGHLRDAKQIFWPYHWFVRQGGRAERLLRDDEIGWQAGNWEVNCRSIAICFDGDFENSRPSDADLACAARIIREQYPNVLKERVLGHCEVAETACPSKLFLTTEVQHGWKEDLLAFL